MHDILFSQLCANHSANMVNVVDQRSIILDVPEKCAGKMGLVPLYFQQPIFLKNAGFLRMMVEIKTWMASRMEGLNLSWCK